MSTPPPLRPPRLGELAAAPADTVLADAEGWLDLHLDGVDLDGSDLARLEVRSCRVERSRLMSAKAGQTRWVDVVLDACEMAGLLLEEASLTRVEVRRSRLSGSQVFGARLADVRFVSCRMDGVSLRFTKGERVWFEDCDLRGAEFIGAELAAVRFDGCDLGGADFGQAKVPDARLVGSQVDSIRNATGLQRPVISAAQVLPFALSLFTLHGVVVEDE